MSSCSSRIIRKPSRTSVWSSAISTRDHVLARNGSRARTRKPPCSGGAGLELAAEERGTLAHADQTVPAGRRRRRARAVVVDLELQRVGREAHEHLSLRRACVLERVRQRLLHDPKRRKIDPGRQRPRVPSTTSSTGSPDSRTLASSSSRLAMPGCGARAGRSVGLAQHAEHPTHVAERRTAGLLDRPNRRPRAFRSVAIEHLVGASACTTMTLTLWAMMSCSSRAIRARSEPPRPRRVPPARAPLGSPARRSCRVYEPTSHAISTGDIHPAPDTWSLELRLRRVAEGPDRSRRRQDGQTDQCSAAVLVCPGRVARDHEGHEHAEPLGGSERQPLDRERRRGDRDRSEREATPERQRGKRDHVRHEQRTGGPVRCVER